MGEQVNTSTKPIVFTYYFSAFEISGGSDSKYINMRNSTYSFITSY